MEVQLDEAEKFVTADARQGCVGAAAGAAATRRGEGRVPDGVSAFAFKYHSCSARC